MTPIRTIRRITAWWHKRCAERRLAEIPGWKKIEADLAERRRRHKATRDLIERRQEPIHQNMRGV